METTAGVTCSAIASNAVEKSARGLTSCADGRELVRAPCWAQPKRVRSEAEAKTRPEMKAVATAAPTRARASFDDMVLGSGSEVALNLHAGLPTGFSSSARRGGRASRG